MSCLSCKGCPYLEECEKKYAEELMELISSNVVEQSPVPEFKSTLDIRIPLRQQHPVYEEEIINSMFK